MSDSSILLSRLHNNKGWEAHVLLHVSPLLPLSSHHPSMSNNMLHLTLNNLHQQNLGAIEPI